MDDVIYRPKKRALIVFQLRFQDSILVAKLAV